MGNGGAKEPHCFEDFRAKDGRLIRLTKARYDTHIRDEHRDLERDYAYPVSEIQKALETGDVTPGNKPDTVIYTGPIVRPNSITSGFVSCGSARRFRVVVRIEANNKGVVTTAYAPIERAKGGTARR